MFIIVQIKRFYAVSSIIKNETPAITSAGKNANVFRRQCFSTVSRNYLRGLPTALTYRRRIFINETSAITSVGKNASVRSGRIYRISK